jgi:pyruvate/2-oxoglutarate dehydrogenase complex dihydrolipoamide acyltransferase (E2) component
MMFMALSYDHRIIDGKDAVGFLMSVRENVVNLAKTFRKER